MIHDAQVHLCQRCYAVILAGGRGTRLGPLTDRRAKPGVPFGGKLKIIDFALSNCVNSGIRRIGVLTQYKAQSLIRHVEHGWHFLAGSLGEFVDVVPAQQQHGEAWYAGTADAVWQNRDLVRESRPRHVLVLAGDHIYKMDYARMLADHIASGAQASVACLEVPCTEAARAFGVMATDDGQRIVAFHEKPQHPRSVPGHPGQALASMGIYVFDADCLFDALERDAACPDSRHDFGLDLIPGLIDRAHLHAHRFADSCMSRGRAGPYWRDVGTIDAYWAANMDLLRPQPELDLHDDGWPILSQQRQLPPAQFIDTVERDRDLPGQARQSLVCSGCVVQGAQVWRSILFPKVRLGPGTEVEDTLLLPNVSAARDVRLRRAIIDKHCSLPDGFQAGLDPAADGARGFHLTPGGVTLVTAAMLGQEGHHLD